MFHERSLARVCRVALGLFLLSGTAAIAQLQTGNLYGKVSDQTGAVLPGVTVTLDTGEAPQVQVTNAQGEFRFLSLPPASYKIKAERQGFSPVEYPHISINVGRNTNIEVTMSSAIEDIITVTSESPLLDEKAIRTGATISRNELQKIPTARDPWSVLQSTPGVLLDRVNVGGNESGQQASYTGPGSFATQSVWSVDGVVITDMAATGGSPAYYDFDSFEEMQISTGGSDSTIATGGVVLNLVTKRGTNEYRGSARYLQAPGGAQSSTSLKASDLPAAQQPSFLGRAANKINKVEDFGGEIGGPIIKDHLWAWGAYGEQKVSVNTFPTALAPNGLTDNTKLPAWNAKVNSQLTSSNSLTLFGMNSAKEKQGRNAGPTRAQETSWNQGQFGGKPTLIKAEDTQIFSPNLYLTVLYSHVYGGFFLLPQSGTGPDVPAAFLDSHVVWHNSFQGITIKRPQNQEKADASTFFNTGSLSHELKYGASYRQADAVSTVGWQGAGYIESGALAGTPPGTNLLYLARAADSGVHQTFTSAYAQDTLTSGSLTANLGLRYDRQGGRNLPETAPANPVRPDLLPASSYAGAPIGFTWTSWSPRVGLTYALGKDRSTLLRGSYARFADQLSADGNHASILNPTATLSYYYAYTTNPGDGHVTPGQVLPGFGYSGNVNPHDPAQLLVANAVDHGLQAPVTDELLVSAEHALLPELVVGVNLTYRKQTKLLQQDQLVFDGPNPGIPGDVGRVATRADYVPVTVNAVLPSGAAVPVTYFVLRPGVTTGQGLFLHNGDYETTFKGAAVTFNKRLSNRWMLRGNLSYADWYYSKAGDRPDPTIQLAGGITDGNYVAQGDQVLQGSGTASGSKAFVFINSKWSFALNGMYQISPDRPWGFNVAGNLTGRQGYPDPFFIKRGPPLPGGAVADFVQIGAADSNRLDNIVDFDLRVEKEFTFNDFGLTLGVDCFNVFNEAFVLQRRDRTFTTQNNAGFVTEVLSPRIFRFGARLSFK